jgi:hypothetical protein
MFKRYLPGTKKLSSVKMPQIRPIEIGYAKYGKTTGPLFRRKQKANTWVEYNNNIAAMNAMPKTEKLPAFEVMKGNRVKKSQIKGAVEGDTEYKNRKVSTDDRLDPSTIYQEQFSDTQNPIESSRRGVIPQYANIRPRYTNRGRPEGSKNKKGTKLQLDDKSAKYLSGHATGKYKKNHKAGKPVTIRVMSKFGVHYENKLDANGNAMYTRSGTPVWVKVNGADTLNWTHLSRFRPYGGEKPRPLPKGYDGTANSPDQHPPFSRSLIQDGQRRAMMPGFRISVEGQDELREIKKGRSQWTVPKILKEHGYYEYRRNRSDASPKSKTKISVGKRRKSIGRL